MDDDWSLIVSSFQTQYGIRLSSELSAMGWREFSYLLEGLSGETPLGRIIAIRAENDPETLKSFTASERQIRNEYRKKIALNRSEKECESAYESMKQAFLNMAK